MLQADQNQKSIGKDRFSPLSFFLSLSLSLFLASHYLFQMETKLLMLKNKILRILDAKNFKQEMLRAGARRWKGLGELVWDVSVYGGKGRREVGGDERKVLKGVTQRTKPMDQLWPLSPFFQI